MKVVEINKKSEQDVIINFTFKNSIFNASLQIYLSINNKIHKLVCFVFFIFKEAATISKAV